MRYDYAPLVPPGGTPPPDAVEIYQPAPMSFSLAVDAMARQGEQWRDSWEAARQLYIDSAAQTLRDLQRGMSAPSTAPDVQVSLAVEVHSEVPGSAVARLHQHVYVGATVDDPARGRVPLDRHFLDIVVPGLDADHGRFLQRQTEDLFGFVWKRGEIEAFAPYIDQYPVTRDAACPGVHGPGRDRIYADDATQRLRARRAERRRAS
uniref:hypothetical protein n=1 Tax=Promicromonospora sp. CA-289581 TaxID=3240013 RepID=UPI003F495BE8